MGLFWGMSIARHVAQSDVDAVSTARGRGVDVGGDPAVIALSPPTGLAFVSGSRTGLVYFTPPVQPGDVTILGYQVSCDDGVTWSPRVAPASPAEVSLSHGRRLLRVRVRAVAEAGVSEGSDPIVIPGGRPPGRPAVLRAQVKDDSATVWFRPPSDMGTPISGYEYSIDDRRSWAHAGTHPPIEIAGLASGRAYLIWLRAENCDGVVGLASKQPAYAYLP